MLKRRRTLCFPTQSVTDTPIQSKTCCSIIPGADLTVSNENEGVVSYELTILPDSPVINEAREFFACVFETINNPGASMHFDGVEFTSFDIAEVILEIIEPNDPFVNIYHMELLVKNTELATSYENPLALTFCSLPRSHPSCITFGVINIDFSNGSPDINITTSFQTQLLSFLLRNIDQQLVLTVENVEYAFTLLELVAEFEIDNGSGFWTITIVANDDFTSNVAQGTPAMLTICAQPLPALAEAPDEVQLVQRREKASVQRLARKETRDKRREGRKGR